MKTTIAKEVVLAYPDFTKPFNIYTDASTKQLGSVITKDNRPIAFFSRKLAGMHRHHKTKFCRVGGKNGESKVPNDMAL